MIMLMYKGQTVAQCASQVIKQLTLFAVAAAASSMNHTNMENFTEEVLEHGIEAVAEQFNYHKILFIVFEITMFCGLFIGVFCDVLLVYIVCANKLMRTRPYIITANWAICNVYLLLRILLETLIGLSHITGNHTFLMQLDCFMVINQQILMLMLLPASLCKSEKIPLLRLLAIIYSTEFVIVLLFIFIPISHITGGILNLMLMLIIHAILLLTLLIKEIITFCNRTRDPISALTRLRMNIVRIIVYNLTGIVVLKMTLDIFRMYSYIFDFVFISLPLNSLYILLYLIKADKDFKLCFVNTFRRSIYKYNVAASLAINGDDTVRLDI